MPTKIIPWSSTITFLRYQLKVAALKSLAIWIVKLTGFSTNIIIIEGKQFADFLYFLCKQLELSVSVTYYFVLSNFQEGLSLNSHKL